MQTLCLSSLSPHTLSLHSTSLNPTGKKSHLSLNSTFLGFNPLPRISSTCDKMWNMNKCRRGSGPVCYASPLAPHNLHWVSAVSAAVLMLVKGTAINKSFLVPLFALQAPLSIISWIKGEYGIWSAFLALLVRLFFFIPGELELPFVALLLIILAPYQAINLRGRQEGNILSLAIAGYLAFQHFSRAGSLKRAFDQGSIPATVAIICIVVVPCALLF